MLANILTVGEHLEEASYRGKWQVQGSVEVFADVVESPLAAIIGPSAHRVWWAHA